MSYTYYRTEFEVEWGNGNTETITHESSHKADRLPKYGDRIHIDVFSHAYTRRGLLLRWGHEGIVVRSKHPFHYDQIEQRLGKYVRPGHVKEDEKHWSKRPLVQNELR